MSDSQEAYDVLYDLVGKEVADEVSKFFSVHTDADYYELESDLEISESDKEELEMENSDLEYEIDELNEKLDRAKSVLEDIKVHVASHKETPIKDISWIKKVLQDFSSGDRDIYSVIDVIGAMMKRLVEDIQEDIEIEETV